MKRTLSLLLTVMCLLSACSLDATALLDRQVQNRAPSLNRSERSFAQEPQTDAAVLRLVMDGKTVGDIPDAVAADKLYRAVSDGQHSFRDEVKTDFTRQILVLDGNGRELLAVNLADDGSDLMEKDGTVFVIPAYAYAMMESALWNVGKSLGQRQVEADENDTALLALQQRLETDMQVLLMQRFGVADGYFAQWEILDTQRTRDNITLCLLLRYGLYRLEEDALSCLDRETAALKLVYDWQEGNLWQLGTAKMSDPDAEDEKASVRSVFDFDLTQSYRKAAKDAEKLDWDLEAQAKEFLRRRSLGRYSIE